MQSRKSLLWRWFEVRGRGSLSGLTKTVSAKCLFGKKYFVGLFLLFLKITFFESFSWVFFFCCGV